MRRTRCAAPDLPSGEPGPAPPPPVLDRGAGPRRVSRIPPGPCTDPGGTAEPACPALHGCGCPTGGMTRISASFWPAPCVPGAATGRYTTGRPGSAYPVAMHTSQTPSVGCIVVVSVDHDENNGAQIAPAIITRVWNDDMVNVTVFPDVGDPYPCTSIQRVDDLDPDVVRRWAWPPRVG